MLVTIFKILVTDLVIGWGNRVVRKPREFLIMNSVYRGTYPSMEPISSFYLVKLFGFHRSKYKTQ